MKTLGKAVWLLWQFDDASDSIPQLLGVYKIHRHAQVKLEWIRSNNFDLAPSVFYLSKETLL